MVCKVLPTYNRILLYVHRQVDVTLELDACLTDFGCRSGNFVYHLPIERGFQNWTIVHLEMVNILIAINYLNSNGRLARTHTL